MTLPTDQINAAFEVAGAVFMLLNIRRLLIDKKLAGVSIIPTVVYSFWGLWNLYFYPAVGQVLSFYAGIGIFVANLIWIALAVYYSRKS